jgi:putative FmdB family regulatory protein
LCASLSEPKGLPIYANRGSRSDKLKQLILTHPVTRVLVEAIMPVYDYICKDCHKSFESIVTLKEHDQEKISCPHCGSKNVEQEPVAFFAVTSKKS